MHWWAQQQQQQQLQAGRGWHAGIYLDELYLRFGAAHTRSLELLANLFLPALAAAEHTAAELARGRQRAGGRMAGRQGQSGGGRVDDLRVLERVECSEIAGEAEAKPGPGQAVFYGIGTPGGGRREHEDAAAGRTHAAAQEREAGGDGWVQCCEWHYWGLRRVVQIALPRAPLRGRVPLLDGLVLDSLEVELSFLDPLTATFEVRAV